MPASPLVPELIPPVEELEKVIREEGKGKKQKSTINTNTSKPFTTNTPSPKLFTDNQSPKPPGDISPVGNTDTGDNHNPLLPTSSPQSVAPLVQARNNFLSLLKQKARERALQLANSNPNTTTDAKKAMEIGYLLGQGYSNAQIAAKLQLHPQTIHNFREKHINTALAKVVKEMTPATEPINNAIPTSNKGDESPDSNATNNTTTSPLLTITENVPTLARQIAADVVLESASAGIRSGVTALTQSMRKAVVDANSKLAAVTMVEALHQRMRRRRGVMAKAIKTDKLNVFATLDSNEGADLDRFAKMTGIGKEAEVDNTRTNVILVRVDGSGADVTQYRRNEDDVEELPVLEAKYETIG